MAHMGQKDCMIHCPNSNPSIPLKHKLLQCRTDIYSGDYLSLRRRKALIWRGGMKACQMLVAFRAPITIPP